MAAAAAATAAPWLIAPHFSGRRDVTSPLFPHAPYSQCFAGFRKAAAATLTLMLMAWPALFT